jgi:hypothetical protein
MWRSIHNTVMGNMTEVSEHAIAVRLAAVRARVDRAALATGRDPAGIRIIGVSKRHPPEAVRAALAAGLEDIGENFVQEAIDKMDAIGPNVARWHFIGALQSNKTAAVAGRFDWVHSIDRAKLAERLSRQRPASLPALDVCVQVRIGDESSKAGVPPGESRRAGAPGGRPAPAQAARTDGRAPAGNRTRPASAHGVASSPNFMLRCVPRGCRSTLFQWGCPTTSRPRSPRARPWCASAPPSSAPGHEPEHGLS